MSSTDTPAAYTGTADANSSDSPGDEQEAEQTDPSEPSEADYSHGFANLFRNESLVSNVDLRVEAAKHYSRFVVGDEEVSVEDAIFGTNGSMGIDRGSRDRTAGSYEQLTVDSEVMLAATESVEETVEGGVHVMAAFGAEAMVGGVYAHTIVGPYLRVAAWTDFLAWGGWAEADATRCELSLLMLRSHFGYAHTAGVRLTMAARLIDDFQTRQITKGALTITGTTYQELGDPSGGVQNEA